MFYRTGRTSSNTLQLAIILLAATSAGATGIIDRVQEIAEHLRSQEFTAEGFEVVELFRAETTEDLEAAVSEGYPMPWLEEILSDETIPEEDRYWLDCRVRAVIAMDLHTFFDRSGNPVTYDAEWILPGENYWRENFILSPFDPAIGAQEFSQYDQIHLRNGKWINRFGVAFGEIAHSTGLLETSRDGTLSAIAGYFSTGLKFRLVLLFSDGNYIVSPIGMEYGRCAVSQSGEYALLAARGRKDTWGSDYLPHRAILLNKDGDIIWENELEMAPIGNTTPVISPDDRYCAVVTQAEDIRTAGIRGMLQVFDIETGQEAWRIVNLGGSTVRFSPNGKYLAISGGNASLIDVISGDLIWSDQVIDRSSIQLAHLKYTLCSNTANIIAGAVWPSDRQGRESVILSLFDHSGNVLASDQMYGNIDVSPNGYLSITENYRRGSDRTVCPFVIRRIMRGGE